MYVHAIGVKPLVFYKFGLVHFSDWCTKLRIEQSTRQKSIDTQATSAVQDGRKLLK
jgi:hypothetical protein